MKVLPTETSRLIIDAFVAARQTHPHHTAYVFSAGEDRAAELKRWAKAFWSENIVPGAEMSALALKGGEATVHFLSIGSWRPPEGSPVFIDPDLWQTVRDVVHECGNMHEFRLRRGTCALAIFEGVGRG